MSRNQTIKPRNTVNIVHHKVLDAYFATMKSEDVYVAEDESQAGETPTTTETTTPDKTYTVRSGDSLGKIASANSTTTPKLIAINDSITQANKNNIKIGQVIIIKKGTTTTSTSGSSSGKGEYTVKSGDSLGKIASANGTTTANLIAINDSITQANKNNLKVGQKIKLSKGNVKQKITFTKLNKASLGEDVYIIVKTEKLQNKPIQININQGKAKGIVKKNTAITVTQNKKETTLIETTVGEYSKNDKLSNKDDFKDWAIAKVKLAPKSKKTLKTYTDQIKKLTGTKTLLYLLIDAHSKSGIPVVYYNKDGKPNDTTITNYWLNSEGKWFELKLVEKKVCPINSKYRSHFVIHCTAGNMSIKGIKAKVKYDKKKKKKRSAAHIYVMNDGSKLEVWPLTEKNVWATKIESKKGLKGQMFHIELNYGAPSIPSEAQYQTLADLYIEASNIEKCWPIIAPHIEVDRGIADGHKDPTDFNYNHFYAILKAKGVPIDSIKKFDHNRYWGHKSYKMPWGSDKTVWPPKLKGNPHK